MRSNQGGSLNADWGGNDSQPSGNEVRKVWELERKPGLLRLAWRFTSVESLGGERNSNGLASCINSVDCAGAGSFYRIDRGTNLMEGSAATFTPAQGVRRVRARGRLGPLGLHVSQAYARPVV